jgi:hypothetical protein
MNQEKVKGLKDTIYDLLKIHSVDYNESPDGTFIAIPEDVFNELANDILVEIYDYEKESKKQEAIELLDLLEEKEDNVSSIGFTNEFEQGYHLCINDLRDLINQKFKEK